MPGLDISAERFDLDAYFERIGYGGEPAAALATLQEIHRGHVRAIPFENLDPLLGRPVRLDVQSLHDKLVRSGRGGYCFEQNLLLAHALRALGFTVIGLAARVLYDVPAGVTLPRTHMLLRVPIEGVSWLADVGFGGLTLTEPLRLEAGVVQPTSHGAYRLRPDDDEFVLEARVRDTWRPLYRFSLAEQLQADYEAANWYTSTHPQSRFVTGLVAARVDVGRRYALRRNELSVHHVGGTTERRALRTVAELHAALAGPLGIDLRNVSGLEAGLARLLTAPAADAAAAGAAAMRAGDG